MGECDGGKVYSDWIRVTGTDIDRGMRRCWTHGDSNYCPNGHTSSHSDTHHDANCRSHTPTYAR